MSPKAKRALAFIAQPKALIFVVALANLVWVWQRESRIDWYFMDYHGYYANTQEAFFLVVASVALLFKRTSASVFAGLISLWTLYFRVVVAHLALASATDVPMFGAEAWRRWWFFFTLQRQNALHLIVAVLILIAALITIGRWVRRSLEGVSNKSLDRSHGERVSHHYWSGAAARERRGPVNSTVGFTCLMKRKAISLPLFLVLLYAPALAQEQSRFTSQYRRPATEAGLFYVQRHGGIILDAEDGFDPRALVLSFDDKPITQTANYPDAPTIPGFYLSSTARFEFERIRVVGKSVYFTTRTIANVHYQFSGTIGVQRIEGARPFPLSFIKGVLTRFNDRRVMSQEEIKFVRV